MPGLGSRRGEPPLPGWPACSEAVLGESSEQAVDARRRRPGRPVPAVLDRRARSGRRTVLPHARRGRRHRAGPGRAGAPGHQRPLAGAAAQRRPRHLHRGRGRSADLGDHLLRTAARLAPRPDLRAERGGAGPPRRPGQGGGGVGVRGRGEDAADRDRSCASAAATATTSGSGTPSATCAPSRRSGRWSATSTTSASSAACARGSPSSRSASAPASSSRGAAVLRRTRRAAHGGQRRLLRAAGQACRGPRGQVAARAHRRLGRRQRRRGPARPPERSAPLGARSSGSWSVRRVGRSACSSR